MNAVVDMMMKMPVIAMVVEGVEAVEYVRKLVGPTEPKSAAPGTIRGDFAHISYGYVDSTENADLFNLIHASADAEEAQAEVKHRFSEQEIHNHDPLHKEFTR